MAEARGSEHQEAPESRPSPRSPSASWWTTLPGILTGLAAILIFEIPATASGAVLRVIRGEETRELPVQL